jgi:uncharacterized protein (TIGR03435 family)
MSIARPRLPALVAAPSASPRSKLGNMRRHLAGLAALFAAIAAGQQTPSFEVASVKPTADSGSRGPKGGTKAGTKNDVRNPALFSIHNATLKRLILHAYSLEDYQLSGGPGWIEDDHYDVDARPEHPSTPDQMKLMLRSLLADRFQLTCHRTTKTVATYILTVAKGGPKFGPYFKPLKDGDEYPSSVGGRIQLGGPLQHFIFLLRANMRTFDPATGPVVTAVDVPPILDRTSLTGSYSMLVSTDTHEDWPATLLHQFGLKLDLQKAPVDMLMIDRAVKPSPN